MAARGLGSLALASLVLGIVHTAHAQMPGGPPPAVGIIRAEPKSVLDQNEFIGRIEATNRVDLVARVTAFLDKRLFTEGAEVKKGDLLYQLEQPPFQADVIAKQGAVAQIQAQLQNANITLGRAQTLLHTPAGQQSVVDTALATQRSYAAQLLSAQANLRTAEIDLDYTAIRAPIDGKIGRTNVTEGNVVGPSTGTLATIVSQDPMYVTFPVSFRTALELRQRYAEKGGFNALAIKLRLPDGRTYGQDGALDFTNNTITQNTDTIVLRGTVPNPPTGQGHGTIRELVDGEFVTVVLQAIKPTQMLTVPRAAVLSNQQGDFVFTVDAQNKVHRTSVQLGQTTPEWVAVTSGLKQNEQVVLDGIQRVQDGITVQPGPAAPPAGGAATGQ